MRSYLIEFFFATIKQTSSFRKIQVGIPLQSYTFFISMITPMYTRYTRFNEDLCKEKENTYNLRVKRMDN
jgi:hypothetical protein